MRAVEPSACSKDSKIRSYLSSGIPMPVSKTLMAKQSSLTSAEISTRPLSVNLTALLTKLSRICCKRFSSANANGNFSEMLFTNCNSFLPIKGLLSVNTTSTISRISTDLRCKSRFISLSLEKSRILLTRLPKRRPLRTIIMRLLQVGSGREPVVPSMRKFAMPIIPLRGVRSSWEVLARNSFLSLSKRCNSAFCSSRV